MKKINYGSFVCEVSVDPDYMLLKHGLCDYVSCTGNFDGTAGRLGARLGRSECCRRRN